MDGVSSIAMMFQEVLVPGVFFSALVLIVYFVMKARTKERLAMIEKGLFLPVKTQNNTLKSGLLIVGLGLGILLGMLISTVLSLEKPMMAAISIALAFVLGGVGLIVFYIIESKPKN